MSMIINGYNLENEEKVNRAIYGVVGRGGELTGGVGEGASDEQKIAEYDRLGGYIKKGKYKVKTGSFFNFKAKKPHAEPQVLLLLTDLDGNTVELPEGEALSPELKAAEKIAENKASKKAKVRTGKKESDVEEISDEE